jgi:SulP family sulfate permease
MSGNLLYVTLGLVALTILIIKYLPKITKFIPAPLGAILIVSLLVIAFDLPSKNVGDLADISGSLPIFNIPQINYDLNTLKIILPYAFILAMIGLIESLLTLTLIDEITGTRGRNSKECVAQGSANIVTGFFGGMGGCAMIGQSMINIKSGGRSRISGICASLFLLCFILFASNLIAQIPIAALTGIMIAVVIGTFEWSSFRIIRKIPKNDAFVLILVSTITVFTDLAIAVIIGVIISALNFAWKSANNLYAITEVKKTKKTYILYGNLFFASIFSFKKIFDPKNDPKDITIDFKYSRVWDHSALQAIDELAEKYIKLKKKLHLLHLSDDCCKLLDKGSKFVESHPDEDPHYRVVMDYQDIEEIENKKI